MKMCPKLRWMLRGTGLVAMALAVVVLTGCETAGDPMAEDGRRPSTDPAAENPYYHPRQPDIALEGAAAGMNPIEVQEVWGSQEVLLNE